MDAEHRERAESDGYDVSTEHPRIGCAGASMPRRAAATQGGPAKMTLF